MKIPFWALALFVALLQFPASQTVQAQSEEGESSTEKTATQSQEKEDAKPEVNLELDEDASIEDTEKFIADLQKARPTSYEEAMRFRSAMMKAQQQIVKLLEEAGETDSERYFNAKRMMISSKLSDIGNPEKADETLDSIMSFLSSLEENFSQDDSRLAVMAAYYVTNAKVDEDTSGKFFTEVKKILKSAEVDTSKDLAMLDGFIRRQNLIGETLKLSGTTMAGKPFDIADLKGKVVLVDFWATWCGPCVAEHPNIEKNYELYSDRGFEVVGVSLDRNRKQLEEFVKEHDTQWIVLHDEGGENEATTYYGVMGIPSMFLLNQEGKVVSTTARGPALGAELAKLLGKPETENQETGVELNAVDGSDSN